MGLGVPYKPFLAVRVKLDQEMVKLEDGSEINTIQAGQGPPLVMWHGFGAAVGFWAS